jgi:hypothetical protein
MQQKLQHITQNQKHTTHLVLAMASTIIFTKQ